MLCLLDTNISSSWIYYITLLFFVTHFLRTLFVKRWYHIQPRNIYSPKKLMKNRFVNCRMLIFFYLFVFCCCCCCCFLVFFRFLRFFKACHLLIAILFKLKWGIYTNCDKTLSAQNCYLTPILLGVFIRLFKKCSHYLMKKNLNWFEIQ